MAAYYDLVPGFEKLLAQNGGDLEKFYSAAERLSQLPKKQRHQELTALFVDFQGARLAHFVGMGLIPGWGSPS